MRCSSGVFAMMIIISSIIKKSPWWCWLPSINKKVYKTEVKKKCVENDLRRSVWTDMKHGIQIELIYSYTQTVSTV